MHFFFESVKCQTEMSLHDQIYLKMSNFIIICILHRWSVLGIFCLLEARWDAHIAQAINVKVQEMRPLKHYFTLALIMNLSYKYLHAAYTSAPQTFMYLINSNSLLQNFKNSALSSHRNWPHHKQEVKAMNENSVVTVSNYVSSDIPGDVIECVPLPVELKWRRNN